MRRPPREAQRSLEEGRNEDVENEAFALCPQRQCLASQPAVRHSIVAYPLGYASSRPRLASARALHRHSRSGGMEKHQEAVARLAEDAYVMRHVTALPYLLQIGCCPRCALRFINAKTYPLYREEPDFIRSVIQMLVERVQPAAAAPPPPPQPAAPQVVSPAGRKRGRAEKEKEEKETKDHKEKEKEKESVCVACLGILQRASETQFVDEFIDNVKASGYDKSDFQLAISVPHSTYVRNFAIWYDLRTKFLHTAKMSDAPGTQSTPCLHLSTNIDATARQSPSCTIWDLRTNTVEG